MKNTLIYIALLVVSSAYANENITLPKAIEDKGYPLAPYSKPVSPKAKEIAKRAQQEAQSGAIFVIDNSIPGKWNVQNSTIVYEINGKKEDDKPEKLFNEDYCLSKEDIEKSKRKVLSEKLALSNMQCITKYTEGSLSEMTFTLTCNKSIPEEKFKSTVIVKGSVLSLPKRNEMILDYDLKSEKNGKPADSTKFTVKSTGKHIGRCMELEEVTKKVN